MPRAIIIIICFSLTFVLGFFLLLPNYEKLQNAEIVIVQKELEIQSQEDYLNNLKIYSQKLEEHKENLSKIDSALPQELSPPSLFNYLYKASDQNGLILEDFGYLTIPSSEKKNIQETMISLSLYGSYSAFKNFISTLEKSARFIEITSISFSAGEESSSFSFRCVLKVYSYQ